MPSNNGCPGGYTRIGLSRLVDIISLSGNPDEEFFYLGGPMSDKPQYNFPRFFEVADVLRSNGYNIVSPAELDDKKAQAAALASPDGKEAKVAGMTWGDFLARDLIVVSLPKCLGGIFIEGWEDSRGALLESYVLDRLGKTVHTYEDGPRLTLIDRDEHLAEVEYARKAIREYRPMNGQISVEEALAELEQSAGG